MPLPKPKISKSELERLAIESQKPFICPNEHCTEYRTKPICETHAHVKCELYSENKYSKNSDNKYEHSKKED